MRLDKLLSQFHYGSRNDIKKLAKNGVILVNDQPIKDASIEVDPTVDVIDIAGERLFYQEHLYLMMNKPTGVVSSATDPVHVSYLDYVPDSYRRFDLQVCGRLDVDTTGLLLLTNDGDYLHRVISPKKDIYKTYAVLLDQPLFHYEKLLMGVTILDGKSEPYKTEPAIITDVVDRFCRIKIKEGKFHQVKRMFEAIGYQVIQLKREAIGGLHLDNLLAEGQIKLLTDEEKDRVFDRETLEL